MKKMIVLSLVAILLFQANSAFAYSMPYGATDPSKLLELVKQGKLSDGDEDDALEIFESGGDVLRDTKVLPRDQNAMNEYAKRMANKSHTKNIEGEVGIEEVQNFAVEKTIGFGDWAFEFIFIDKNGNEKVISSYNSHNPMRPGSTMKLFTAWASMQRDTYPIGSANELHTMTHAMRWSDNIEADEMLRSVARANPNFVVPADSYLHTLLGYGMDNGGGKMLTIDQLIIRGCSILLADYSGLQDFKKFHPVNGSGLQDSLRDEEIHKNQVTAAFEISLLKKILKSKNYDRYKQTLPSPEGEGTLKNSFKKTDYPVLRNKSKIYAKTGTLSKAKALTGFVEIPQGKIVFAVLSDNLLGLTAKEALSGPIQSIVAKNINYVLQNAK